MPGPGQPQTPMSAKRVRAAEMLSLMSGRAPPPLLLPWSDEQADGHSGSANGDGLNSNVDNDAYDGSVRLPEMLLDEVSPDAPPTPVPAPPMSKSSSAKQTTRSGREVKPTRDATAAAALRDALSDIETNSEPDLLEFNQTRKKASRKHRATTAVPEIGGSGGGAEGKKKAKNSKPPSEMQKCDLCPYVFTPRSLLANRPPPRHGADAVAPHMHDRCVFNSRGRGRCLFVDGAPNLHSLTFQPPTNFYNNISFFFAVALCHQICLAAHTHLFPRGPRRPSRTTSASCINDHLLCDVACIDICRLA